MPRLRDLVEARAELAAIEAEAAAAFARLPRTDMRAGVANMIRRLAQLARQGVQPIDEAGWRELAAAAALLDRPGLTPSDVRALDERLQSVGLDVEPRGSTTQAQEE